LNCGFNYSLLSPKIPQHVSSKIAEKVHNFLHKTI
jgi:hypothetical protein